MLLKDKVAIITGATRGIGRAIALRFAQEGCDIAFCGRSRNENMIAVEEELNSLGVKAKGYVADVAKLDSAQQFVAEVLKDFGHLDILINNAGITDDAAIKRMTEEQWDEVLRVNLKSVFNYTHAVTPIMLRARKGSIISLASIVGVSGNPGQANYAASKAGIIAFTKSIAKEFGARGVRANAVAPGYIDTAMTQALPQEVRDGFVQRIPMHRAGTPEEVAQVVLFLASDMSSYVSGQVIAIDGAMG